MSHNIWSSHQTALQQLMRSLRCGAALTQQELAALLGKPQSYVSKYESGERKLDIVELREVCLKCGISLESFAHRFEIVLAQGEKQ
ncbi:MAG: helix-turn-helix transcriptional regulator [Gammaproteobacteria bacterium]|nr:helix-turn-helix transcriptional regulator [Gammaproteobacteria bacterium]